MDLINVNDRANWGLLTAFLQEMEEYLSGLQSQMNEMSEKEIRSVLHQMLGSCRIMGFEKIVDEVIQMQCIIKGGYHSAYIKPNIKTISKELNQLFDFLTDKRDQYQIGYWYEKDITLNISNLAGQRNMHLSTFVSLDGFFERLLAHNLSVAILEFEQLSPHIIEILDFNESFSETPILIVSKVLLDDISSLVSKYPEIKGALSPEVNLDQLLDATKAISNGRSLLKAK